MPALLPAVDVGVVGAGLAGLVAALDLQAAGFSVRLLEAAPAAGGRMRRRRLPPLDPALGPGPWVDAGGQWVGPDHTRLLALLDRCGIHRFPSPCEGATVLSWGGERFPFHGFFQGFAEGDPPPVPAADWADAMAVWQRFEALAASLPATAHPHHQPESAALDGRSFGDWIAAEARTPFAAWTLAYFCRAVGFLGPAEPREVSLLHVLWGQRTAPQQLHPEAELLHGGAGQLPERLVAALGEGVVRCGEPVEAIHQSDPPGPVEVRTNAGVHHARAVIVALPPARAEAITFAPPLPPDRQELQRRMAMGACAKVLVGYPSPWWRELGLSGVAIGDRPWVELCADSSDPATGAGVLAAFVVGDRYRRWARLGESERRQAVLGDLAAWFGPRALNPSGWLAVDWPAEPYVGGAFAGWMPPGLWSSCGEALLRPHGRVHWAGTETATSWAGFFEGAVRSGEAAAARVRQDLGI
jgi:monoamine oxidase